MTEFADFIVFIGGPVLIWIGAGAILCHLIPWDNR